MTSVLVSTFTSFTTLGFSSTCGVDTCCFGVISIFVPILGTSTFGRSLITGFSSCLAVSGDNEIVLCSVGGREIFVIAGRCEMCWGGGGGVCCAGRVPITSWSAFSFSAFESENFLTTASYIASVTLALGFPSMSKPLSCS